MAKMGKEHGTGAIDAILGWLRGEKEREDTAEIDRKREEVKKEAEDQARLKQFEKEVRERQKEFERIDKKYRLSDSLREINKRALKGRGQVQVMLPEYDSFNPIPLKPYRGEEVMSVFLDWDRVSQEVRRMEASEYPPYLLRYVSHGWMSSKGICIRVKGDEGTVKILSGKARGHEDESNELKEGGFVTQISLNDPNFNRKFQESLIEAFKNAQSFSGFY